MVKCLKHGLRGFNGAVQRRLATVTVTMVISSCWQLSSEVELRPIFDFCKRWSNSGSHEFVKKNMVRYMRPHGRFAHCLCKNTASVKMQHEPTAWSRVQAVFSHLQCANRPFWPLVSKYTIFNPFRWCFVFFFFFFFFFVKIDYPLPITTIIEFCFYWCSIDFYGIFYSIQLNPESRWFHIYIGDSW